MKQPTFKKLILDDLKKHKMDGIAAQITSITYDSYSMGNSVNVQARNLTKSEREKLDSFLKEYQNSSFDSMTDCSIYHGSKKPRSAKHVFLRVAYSEDITEAVKVHLARYWGIVDDTTSQAKMGCWYDSAVHRIRSGCEDFAQLLHDVKPVPTLTLVEEITQLDDETRVSELEEFSLLEATMQRPTTKQRYTDLIEPQFDFKKGAQ